MEELRIACDTHGERTACAVCPHHLSGAGKGWYMLGSGDDRWPDVICFECLDAWPEDMSAEEAGIEPVMVCSQCYELLRERHDVGAEDR